MKCSEIIENLEKLSPPSYALEWDNVGLLAGRKDKETHRVYLALDATDAVIDEALQRGVDLLVTHHPLIFTPMKRVNTEDFIGRRLVKLLRNDIGCYAMHTNFDVMGMADAVADEIGLKDRQVLDVTYEDEIAKEGIGRIGCLPRRMTLEECADFVRKTFRLDSVRIYGEPEKEVTLAAVAPGSGKSMIAIAAQRKAEVLITGDIEHHEGLDALAQGVTVVDAGHYGLEKIFIPYMQEYIKREMPQLTVYTAKEKNPFWVLQCEKKI